MQRWGQLAVIAAVLSFGLGNVIVVDSSLTGPQIAFWRFLLASVLYGLAHRAFVGPLRFSDFRIAAPAGIALGLEVGLFFMSLRATTVANTTLIGTMTPLVLFGVAARKFGERVSRELVAVTAIALAGVALVVFGSSGAAQWSAYGDALAVVSMLTYAAYFTLAKVARQSLSGFTLQTHAIFATVPVVFALTMLQSGRVGVPAGGEWLDVVGLVALPTTGHLLINWSHRYVRLTTVSLLVLGVPVASVAASMIFLNDTVVRLQVIGASVVMAMLVWAVLATARLEA